MPRAIFSSPGAARGQGYDWPSSEHSIFVDHAGNVWITGNGAKDRQAIKLTSEGKFILEIGHPSAAPMNNSDISILGRPAGIDLDEKAHEIYFADGYLNRRVIVFDSETGVFKRMWGAYGNAPSDTDLVPYAPGDAPSQLFRNPVHAVHISKDGLVYVCDRINDRIQIFTKEGKVRKGIHFAARRRWAMDPPTIWPSRMTRPRSICSWPTAKIT